MIPRFVLQSSAVPRSQCEGMHAWRQLKGTRVSCKGQRKAEFHFHYTQIVWFWGCTRRCDCSTFWFDFQQVVKPFPGVLISRGHTLSSGSEGTADDRPVPVGFCWPPHPCMQSDPCPPSAQAVLIPQLENGQLYRHLEVILLLLPYSLFSWCETELVEGCYRGCQCQS